MAQQVGDCPQKEMEIPAKNSSETVAAWYQRVIAFLNSQSDSRGNYCEFRDNPVHKMHIESATVTISNADAGQYIITKDGTKISLLSGDTEIIVDLQRHNLTQGETKTIRLGVMPLSNYTPGDTSTNAIVVLPPGSSLIAAAVARHEITVVDDDNFYYIGQRNHHPYGESWNSQPHCYSPGCAWD